MRKLPTRMRLFIGGVIVAAAAAGLATFGATPRMDQHWPTTLAILLALAIAGQIYPVHVALKVKVTPSDVATFAAALTLGPFLSMLVAACSVVIGLHFSRPRITRTWYSVAFNAGASALGTGAAAAVFGSLAAAGSELLAEPGAIAVAAISKYAVNRGLVDTVVALQLRHDPFARWWNVHRRDLAEQGTLYVFGAIAAVAATWSPFALVLFGAPMVLFQIATAQTARLRTETLDLVRQLADIVDLRDPYTHGHSQRVAGLAERLARRLRMQQVQIELVREAARLHDIGKIGTDDHVLRKPGPLTEEEPEMRRHADIGHQIVARLGDLADAAELVRSHHERYDGGGYPRQLRGNELPLELGVIAVSDAYDAMTTDRPYRQALSWGHARAELLTGRGSQWHPAIVDAFIAMIDEGTSEPRAVATPAPAAAAPAD